MVDDIETQTRQRLRALRQGAGWSLDELAERAHLSSSVISRIETGKRSIGLDVLVPLARALGVSVDALVTSDDDHDVVIRPTPVWHRGMTMWNLSRPGSSTVAMKILIEPSESAPEPQVHPGHDWMFVLSGAVALTLGDRRIEVNAGEAAEFSTMTPHCFEAVGAPAELMMVFDSFGRSAHLHSDDQRGDDQRGDDQRADD